ncbi:MAG TPA: hypothetical protein VEY95_00665 [Azospirillaceae bacterium]|nr:hypothetical protein [Azospirillaceae bacterium]
MLLQFTFPIADMRGFLPEGTARLAFPSWPDARPDEEFVRLFGHIRKRRRGGIAGWIGEATVCNASRAFSFTPPSDGTARQFRVAYRRLYSDGLAVTKLDVGVCPIFAGRQFHLDTDLEDLTSELLHSKVCIKQDKDQNSGVALAGLGRGLVPKYVCATTASRADVQFAKGAVRACPPVAVVEWRGELESAPGDDAPFCLISGFNRVSTGDRSPCKLYFHHVAVAGEGEVPVWFIIYKPGEFAKARALRVYISRLHAEHHVLRRILQSITKGILAPRPGTPESDLLQEYINKATARISKVDRNARGMLDVTEFDAESMAHLSYQLTSPGELDALIDRLSIIKIRKNIERKAIDYANKPPSIINISVENSKDVEVKVGDDYKVGQAVNVGRNIDAKNQQNTQHNQAQVASADMEKLAEELRQLAEALRRQAATPEQEVAAEQVDAASKAASEGNPNKISVYLKNAGSWALDVAKGIGIPLAVAALKRQIGLP